MKSKCIETNLFTKYVEGCFSEEEREQVEVHLSACARCREILVNAHSLIHGNDLPEWEPASEVEVQSLMKNPGLPDKFENIYKWIKGRLPSGMSLNPLFTTVPCLTRKSSAEPFNDYILLEKETVDDLKIHLCIEKTETNTFNIWATVLQKDKKARNIRLVFMREGGGIVSRPLTGDYENFKDMSFGSYNFIIKQDAEEKGCCYINIKKEEVIVKDDYS